METAYNRTVADLTAADCSADLLAQREHFLCGGQTLAGIPFALGAPNGNNILLVKDEPAALAFAQPVRCKWLVILHGADYHAPAKDEDGFVLQRRGNPILGETVAEYGLRYADGSRHAVPIKRRFEINEFQHPWGDGGFLCVPHTKPAMVKPATEWIHQAESGGSLEEMIAKAGPPYDWGNSQTRVQSRGSGCELTHWLYALENPHPEKPVASVEFAPTGDGNAAFVFGVTATELSEHPLRWEPEKRFEIIRKNFDETLLDIDLGAVTSVTPAKFYDNDHWEYCSDEGGAWSPKIINLPPEVSGERLIVGYTAHPDAALYYDSTPLPKMENPPIEITPPSVKVVLKALDKNDKPVAVKLHIHGPHGEYLPPMDRHRYPNPFWFEDYSADFTTNDHFASYIDGKATVMLPPGDVFIEVTKGPEITPIRKKYTITPETKEIVVPIAHVLPWRRKGWVSADTHVHFLSPQTARLEGSGEGVNVVNLLASQWVELFTNVGDFDGRTTVGSAESGGDGEYLVRVGTENRQPVMGHISLLGYEGDIILPLTSGGPDEARIGDAVDTSLSLWAEQNRKQNGITVLPHFPQPRAESAAAIVLDLIDAVEMTSWSNIFGGISPYCLSEWYKYLNCGFHVPAVGGSDKMSSSMPVGGLRTYALIKDGPFTYDSWKASVGAGKTFVTCGPLVDFLVGGKEAGESIDLGKDGGTLDVNWQVSSLITPVTRVQLVFNGEVKETKAITTPSVDYYGSGSLKVAESGWAALRVFGRYGPDQNEIVAAHTSAVMIRCEGKPVYARADAMAILEQIEGATAFVKTIAPRKDERQYAEILSRLHAAHRKLHNMMHENRVYHDHSQDYLHHHK